MELAICQWSLQYVGGAYNMSVELTVCWWSLQYVGGAYSMSVELIVFIVSEFIDHQSLNLLC